MKHAIVFGALLAASSSLHKEATPPAREIQVAFMCFKSGEQISGLNKICYYNCLGSTTAITIRSIDLCPLTIDQ